MAKRRAGDGGLYAYVMTPFNRKGELDTSVLETYVGQLIESGVDGLTCIASTCEGPYLTEAERHRVASTVGRAANGRVRLNVGVGAVSTRQVIEYAKQARDAGATSLMLDMQQYFPISFEDAYRHYQTVAEAVHLPIRLYNITTPTRFDFTPDLVARMAAIRAIESVKEASGEAIRIRDIRALCGDRLKVYCGFHFQALDAFRYGATGWEAALHPLIARPCVELYKALAADPNSNEAERRYVRLEPLFRFFKLNGVPQSIKAMSQWSDLKLGIPRAPLAELRGDLKTRLRSILEDLRAL